MKFLYLRCSIGPVGILLGLVAVVGGTVSVVSAAPTAHDFLQASGVKGGLIVVIGCDAPELLVQIRVNGSYLVHGLDADSATVLKAREDIRSLRSAHASDASRPSLDGAISVSEWDGKGLPYVDNLVNLLVQFDVRRDDSSSSTAMAGQRISMTEIARVLAPRGVALIKDPVAAQSNGRAGEGTQGLERRKCPPELKEWSLYVKRVPSEIADWTHYLHGPDNNALADDSIVGPPHHMQWRSEPLWGRHHDAEKGSYPTVRNVLSASGRLICLIDQTRSSDLTIPSQWAIIARDAFSGVLLWKRSIQVKTYQEHKKKWGLEELWRQLIVDTSHVYVALAPDQPLSALDINTGRTIRSYDGTTGFQEVIKAGNTLSASLRPDPTSAKPAQSDFRNASDWKVKNPPKSTEKAGAWPVPLLFQPRALLRVGTRVFVAGRKSDEGVLQVVSSLDGTSVRQQSLTASPVWDGLAAANGAVYLSLENGTVMCLAGE